MKNIYRNSIVLGDLDYVLLSYFDNIDDKISTLAYNDKLLPLSQSDNGATTINSLHVVNDLMKRILKLKIANNGHLENTCFITIPDKLCKAIQKGSYKTWIKNNGVAGNGNKLSEVEVKEWTVFANLYSELFMDINFRNIAHYSIKAPRYNVTYVNKHKELIKKMKAHINAHKEQVIHNLIAGI
jgi:hypothetical protein